jgi:alpha-tubulin suppressor-like RCC1 family protein
VPAGSACPIVPTLDATRIGLLVLLFAASFSGQAGTPSIVAGTDRICAIDSSGAARCWGDNSDGALGNGVAIQRSTPAAVAGIAAGAKAITAGAFHACAITAAGAAVCWGHNGQGQLGNGTEIESSAPAPVTGLASGVRAIAAGDEHTCALTNAGAVLCWGDGFDGQLGNGSASGVSLVPVPVTGLSSGVVAIAAGGFHTCALTSAGAMLCWGSNDYGQLGNGTTASSTTPVQVSGLTSVTAITTGEYHTCALTASGTVYCWGDNDNGQLGNGSTTRFSVPVPLPGFLSGGAAVSAGAYHTCALNTSGGVLCWGYGHDGQLGNGSTSSSATPVAVSGLSSGMAGLARGLAFDFDCALTLAGGVRCWGNNSAGQLGNGTSSRSLVPTSVSGLASVTAIATGSSFACALTSSGTVSCWGDDSAFQLGDARRIGIPAPGLVVGLSSGVAAISTGVFHTCAATTAGAVRCWGYNVRGELGDGTTNNSSVPVAASGVSSVTAVSAGYFFTCVLDSAGAVSCWGDNVLGQLGDGTTASRFTPVAVAGLSSGVAAISTHTYHTCALTTSGAVLCWGDNGEGELGDGTANNSSVPVPVVGLASGVKAISAGAYHSCALTTAGGVLCWGYNYYGQLGNGTNAGSSVPVPVTGLSSGVAAIYAGEEHTCAITNAGAMLCWGRNDSGQLGNGTTADSSVPVAVTGLSSGVVAIAAGRAQSCALLSAGHVLCWGFNSSGALGDSTLANRTAPVVVVRDGGAGSLATNDWYLDLVPGADTIPADKIPSYLVNATGNATTAVVDVTASVAFRARDAGLPIYVFGYAPSAPARRDAQDKDGATCALVQLNSAGQLQPASASSLNAIGNVVAGQQQSVTILGNVLATNVSGTTLCLGTAATSAQSVDPANSRCVVSVPATTDGGTVCPPPGSASTVTPNLPGALSGLWWNPNESGWGIAFTQRRNVVFAAWYTYDASGNPKWYVASNCTLPAGVTGTSGACSGSLYQVNGPAFFGTAFNPALVNVTTAGTLQVSFADANNATMTYTVAGQTRAVPIVRQVFASGTTAPPVDYTDLWWNPNESGWGLEVIQQFGNIFLAWYVYDANGNPTWYVASNCAVAGSGCSGTLYRTTGPAFGPSFNPAQVQVFSAGTVSLSFSDPNNGTLSYTVNGASASKPITRQLF